MTRIAHKRSPDEPEGGWLSPGGPGGWPDLEALNRRQLKHPPLPGDAELLQKLLD